MILLCSTLEGRVYKSTGSWYLVKTEHGDLIQCRLKGKFRLDEEIRSSNPIAVGDLIQLEIENDEDANVVEIKKRENYVIRQSPKNKHKKHIIASNVDQSILFATLRNPKTSTGFIDRFLVSCEAYHIPAILVFNKKDLYDPDELEDLKFLKKMYEKIGYPVYFISALREEGVDDIKNLLKNKVTLLSGHSGSGKSTFVNSVLKNTKIRTQEVSNWSGKGMHTTTFAEMYDLEDGGSIIDTPGIRELGIFDIDREELAGYFVEMQEGIKECAFSNCLHINEPKCGVLKALENKTIREERYRSYINMLETLKTKGY